MGRLTHAYLDATDLADDVPDRQARVAGRSDAILGAPEAEAQHLVAIALLLRLDISPETAVLYLRQAPPLHTAPEVTEWVEAIPVQPDPETLH